MHVGPLRVMAIAGATMLGGCSLLGGDGGSAPDTPPMIGSAAPEEAAPKFRKKYRFPTEVSNTRKEHLAARRKTTVAQNSGAALASASPAGSASAATPQTFAAPAGGPYPNTGVASFTFASPLAIPPTQRLPDVRQASFREPPLY
jgi:hypothetical protein